MSLYNPFFIWQNKPSPISASMFHAVLTEAAVQELRPNAVNNWLSKQA